MSRPLGGGFLVDTIKQNEVKANDFRPFRACVHGFFFPTSIRHYFPYYQSIPAQSLLADQQKCELCNTERFRIIINLFFFLTFAVQVDTNIMKAHID